MTDSCCHWLSSAQRTREGSSSPPSLTPPVTRYVISPLLPSFQSQHVAYLGCTSYANVLATMQLARSELLEIVSAIEFQDRASMELVLKHIPSQAGHTRTEKRSQL